MRLTEKELLKRTYKDELNVLRNGLIVNQDGESVGVQNMIYVGRPCALSQSKKSPPQREDFSFKVSDEYTIFADPEVVMKENDRAEIVTETGMVIQGITGSTFLYPSHGETKLLVEKAVKVWEKKPCEL